MLIYRVLPGGEGSRGRSETRTVTLIPLFNLIFIKKRLLLFLETLNKYFKDYKIEDNIKKNE
jgi:hypothetical protein